jgi:RES domain
MRAARCGRLARRPLTGTWFRVIRLQHWRTRLSSDHSRTATSRFSAATAARPLYRIIYLGENHQVAIHEARALLGHPHSPIANPKGSWAILGLQVVLNHIVDLSLPAQQKLISTNHAELTGDWLNHPGTAPTQELGQALYVLPGLQGSLYPSSLVNGLCLGLFPHKLGPRSSVIFFNEMTNRHEPLI